MKAQKLKLERQLMLLHIFHYCRVTEYAEITSRIAVSRRTIDRDIAELTAAGVLNAAFSRKQNGFVHKDDMNLHSHKPTPSGNKAKQAHLNKLIRLSKVMFEFDEDTPAEFYAAHFPKVSSRTMQRDLRTLNNIGYGVRYDFWDKQYVYDFPGGMIDIFGG